MDFGLLYEMAIPRPWTATTEHDAYWNVVEQARLADQSGFTHFWAVEHHFREEFSHNAAPEILLSAVAQHTDQIRIGHGVVLLPMNFNHPIRVAERIGALDILSHGRVEFGTGRSLAELELEGFGINPGDSRPQWAEAIDFLQGLWRNGDGEFEFNGKYFQMPSRPIVPRPVQKPHPPMWLASTSPDSYAIAGEYGLGVLAFGMGTDAAGMGRRIDRWRNAMANSTRDLYTKNENAGVFMMAFCAKTDAEARRICEEAFVNYLDITIDVFVRWGRHRELPPGYEWYAKLLEVAKNQSALLKFDHLVENKMILVGSPDTLCEVIEGFNGVGATQMIMAMQLGRIAHEDVKSSIKLFGEAVIPNFR